MMSVEELKRQAAELSFDKQGELAAFLVALRNARDPNYQALMQDRMNEQDRRHWLTPDQFEKQLDGS